MAPVDGWRAMAGRPPCSATGHNRVLAHEERKADMLWLILVVVLALWLLGFIGSVGGAAIHLLLILAAIVLLAQLLSGRSTAA